MIILSDSGSYQEFTEYLSRRFKRVMIEYYGNLPIVTTRPEPLDNLYNRTIKRIFDIVSAASSCC